MALMPSTNEAMASLRRFPGEDGVVSLTGHPRIGPSGRRGRIHDFVHPLPGSEGACANLLGCHTEKLPDLACRVPALERLVLACPGVEDLVVTVFQVA